VSPRRPTAPEGCRVGPTQWALAVAAVHAALALTFVGAAAAVGEPDVLVVAVLFLVPAVSMFLIGRSTVQWDDRELVVRNPLRTHRMPLVDVRSVDFPPRWAQLRPMLVERSDHRMVRVTAVTNSNWLNRPRAMRTAEALRDDVARARARDRARDRNRA
jgi:hypothetical protein